MRNFKKKGVGVWHCISEKSTFAAQFADSYILLTEYFQDEIPQKEMQKKNKKASESLD